MAYVRLRLTDTKVNAPKSMATEPHLEQAYHLLAAIYPGAGSSAHFGTFAAGNSKQQREKAIADYILMKLEAISSAVHTGPLYWCARKMIEALAADPDSQQDIARNMEL
jgi:hypothetical protein